MWAASLSSLFLCIFSTSLASSLSKTAGVIKLLNPKGAAFSAEYNISAPGAHTYIFIPDLRGNFMHPVFVGDEIMVTSDSDSDFFKELSRKGVNWVKVTTSRHPNSTNYNYRHHTHGNIITAEELAAEVLQAKSELKIKKPILVSVGF
ncbi:MAG: hypothetical protein ACK5V3_16520 [Bdellovibrionales bacterium]